MYCSCPPEIARGRYERRAAKATHHPAHVTPILDPALLAEFDQPVRLGTVIEVNTTVAVDIERLTRLILAELAGP